LKVAAAALAAATESALVAVAVVAESPQDASAIVAIMRMRNT